MRRLARGAWPCSCISLMCRHCRAFRGQLQRIGDVARGIAGEIEREPSAAFENRILDRLGS